MNTFQMTKEELQLRLNSSHFDGKAIALEDASAAAKIRAGEEYASGNDTLASFWRSVAKWLADRAARERKNQEN